MPIEPGYPPERIDYMLADSAAKILLTLTAEPGAKNLHFAKEMIDLGTSSPQAPSHSSTFPPFHPSRSSALAYVIYTSGSTGKPKGVMIRQEGLVNYVCWAKRQYVHGEGQRFPLYTSISFDLTVTSLFLPLVSGNGIVIYGGGEDALPLREIAAEGRVDIIKLTPSHLRILPGVMAEGSSSIKTFIVGGEQLESGLAREIHDRFRGGLELYNEYGPTEATVGCMIYKYDIETDLVGAVPIGNPIANAGIYILDADLSPVPLQVAGELYIGGKPLARGYLNNPELTDDRFKNYQENKKLLRGVQGGGFLEKSPPGRRRQKIYKTGDLARRLATGNIEFLGRRDEQVKIRGFRIEMSEVEAQLLTHDRIKEVVVVTAGSGADRELAAYLVPADPVDSGDSAAFEVSDLRAHLLKKLPEYMIPARFIQVDRIPLTANGKIDKSALALLGTRLGTGAEYVAPQSEVENKIAGIWKNLLELDQIGINDNFFELGGNSLKILRVRAELKEVFGGDFPLVNLFRYPTIHLLSLYIKQESAAEELGGSERTAAIGRGKDKLKNLKRKMRAIDHD